MSTPISMAERELAARMTAFTDELRTVAAGLDPEVGWYAAFARRHRAELDAWLSGRELPPWDALADLLQDYAVLHGFAAAERTGWRIRERYEGAARAWDALPDGRDELLRRLAAAGDAEAEAHARERLLAAAEHNARHAGQAQEAERLAALRLWARDDEERNQARQAELRARLAARDATSPGGARSGAAGSRPTGTAAAPTPVNGRTSHGAFSARTQDDGAARAASDGRGDPALPPNGPAGDGRAAPGGSAPGAAAYALPAAPGYGDAAPDPAAPHAQETLGNPALGSSAHADAAPQAGAGPGPADGAGAAAEPAATGRGKGRRKPRGARFAGLDDEAAPVAEARPVPLPEPEAAGSPPPGGSRFAGALRESRSDRQVRLSEEDRRAAAETAARVRRLRAEGHSGAAYVELCEAASGPAERLPGLVAELERAGMASDLATLLWEAASLPPGGLAAVAEALAAAGRGRDCGRVLRQGAARPAAEVGAVAAALWWAGRAEEAVTLLAALVEARSAEEAVLAAGEAPEVVAPLLLDAAQRVSPRHHYAVSSELRRAGMA
ncbi:hypothetical protein [Streptomyces sp. 6N223]|uniref:hypothetical protein n=1 Tax=Streptomyces sp. 6N223 TaxID=3457412 RepID=UPI003FD3251C